MVETCHVDIHARDARGRNVCLAPAEKQHWNVLQYLLETGVDIACTGDFGRTVLHFAALWQQQEIFDWLVQRGADTGAKDHYGKTPSDYLLATATCPSR
jgi:ankyrin repeat protein